jgi:hypothetical protein
MNSETQDTEAPEDPDSCPTSTTGSSATSIPSNTSDMCTTGNGRRFRRSRGGSESQFPGKLYDLLEYASENNLESAISWARNGTAIMVHDPEKLVDILPKFFGQTKYRSFRRQLNMWHFHRIMEGPYRGAFMHPCFIRGNKELITYMSRHVYATVASSPTASSPVDCHDPTPERPIADWRQQLQQQAPPMPGTFQPCFQQPYLLPADVIPTSIDNINLASQDLHQCSNDFNYNLAPLCQPIPGRSDERIQFEPSAICLTESPVLSSANKLKGYFMDQLSDGDPISFAGRQFYYVDHSRPQQKPPTAAAQKPNAASIRMGSPSLREDHLNMNLLDAFADDAPLIVSDVLLEPLSSEEIDSIFTVTDDDDPERQK